MKYQNLLFRTAIKSFGSDTDVISEDLKFEIIVPDVEVKDECLENPMILAEYGITLMTYYADMDKVISLFAKKKCLRRSDLPLNIKTALLAFLEEEYKNKDKEPYVEFTDEEILILDCFLLEHLSNKTLNRIAQSLDLVYINVFGINTVSKILNYYEE